MSLDSKRPSAMEALVVTVSDNPNTPDSDITTELNSYLNLGWVLIEVATFANKTRAFFQRVKKA